MSPVPSPFAARHFVILVIAVGCALLLAIAAPAQVIQPARRPPVFRQAWVMDDRLSALRREPHLQGEVIQRLRAGRPVYILNARTSGGGPTFYRVAVTRRTRGWIHAAAVVAPHRAGDDERLLQRITDSEDLERLRLCDLYLKHFSRSRGAPRALLLMGEAGDRAAEALTRRLRRRLAGTEGRAAHAALRDYYLSDAALDRYSKLGLRFDFNPATGRLVYDGRAYRDLLRRFPRSPEANAARDALAAAEREMARR